MTRDVELKLIDLGIQKLLETFKLQDVVQKEEKNTKKFGRKWSAERRKKFSATMKKKWWDQRKAAQQ